ncbi:hypothetical protein ZWY2020_019660 [Hordeum vulgare]|nr:hypothetical protein ZWY2020_019660 [Hordeum vulgare]
MHTERRDGSILARVKRKFEACAAWQQRLATQPLRTEREERSPHIPQHDAIADLQRLTGRHGLSEGMLLGNFGLDGVEASEDTSGLLVQVFDQQDLGNWG